MTALGLYEEFKELAPGGEKGDVAEQQPRAEAIERRGDGSVGDRNPALHRRPAHLG